MRKMTLFIILIGCMLLNGCSSGNKKSGEEVQKKIEKVGWKITTDETLSNYDTTVFIISENERINISHEKDRDLLVGVVFRKGTEKDYVSVPYGISENIIVQHVVIQDDHSNFTCMNYDLDKNKESDEEDYGIPEFSTECSVIEVERLMEARERVNDLMEETGITTEDLVAWGEWKYNTELIDTKK